MPSRNLDPIGRFRSIVWTDRTGSTNDDLVAEIHALAHGSPAVPPPPMVRLTDEQLAGRGRRERRWVMRAGGGLLFSVHIPWTAVDTAHHAPMIVSVALLDAITETGRAVASKWPNDLVSIEDADATPKFAGILSELVHDPRPAASSRLLGVVVGCGVNVHWPMEEESDADPDLAGATCLDRLRGDPIDRQELARRVIGHLDVGIDELHRLGPSKLLDRYRRGCDTIGRLVRVEHGDGSATVGTATDVDRRGRLVVDVGGRLRSIDVGDVIHLRPSDAPEVPGT